MKTYILQNCIVVITDITIYLKKVDFVLENNL